MCRRLPDAPPALLPGLFLLVPFVLCDTPECGKRYLLRQASAGAPRGQSPQGHNWYDLGLISNNNGTKQDLLKYLMSRCGGGHRPANNCLLEKTLLVLYGAEHLNDQGANFLKNKRVVLVCSNRTKELTASFGNRTLWVNRLTDG